MSNFRPGSSPSGVAPQPLLDSAAGEALLVARRYGLDTAVAVEAVRRSSGASGGFTDAAAYFLDDAGEVDKHGPARTIAKDTALAVELARVAGVRTPVLDNVAEFFARAGAGEYAEQPYPRSTELLEKLQPEPGTPSRQGIHP